jgi:predicted PurR-regulated permease PerM
VPSPARDRDDSPRAQVTRRVVTIAPSTIWLIAGIVVGMSVCVYVLAHASQIFVAFFIAITFAEALRPLVRWLHGRGLPRPVAVLGLYALLAAVLVFLVYLLVSPIVAQAAQLQVNLPRYVAAGRQLLASVQQVLGTNPQLQQALTQLQGQLATLATNLVGSLLLLPLTLASALLTLVVIAAMAFFWLTSTDRLLPFVAGLFPTAVQANVHDVFAEMGLRLGGYVRGVVFNMLVIGLLSGVGDFLLGVPYAVLLGVFAGLTELLPYIGPWISGAAALLVALLTSGLTKGLEVIAWYVVLQTIEGNTLVPVVMSRTVRIHPLTVIVAVLVGGELYGLAGAVLAVPVAAVLQVVVEQVLAPVARTASQGSHAPDAAVSDAHSEGVTNGAEPAADVSASGGEEKEIKS